MNLYAKSPYVTIIFTTNSILSDMHNDLYDIEELIIYKNMVTDYHMGLNYIVLPGTLPVKVRAHIDIHASFDVQVNELRQST